MNIRELHQALGDAIAKLDEVQGIEDRALGAQRRYEQFQVQHAAMLEAHAKIKEDSDAYLAANLAKLSAEKDVYADQVEELKKQRDQLDLLNQQQQENAGNTLTAINKQIGIARQDLAELEIRREKARNEVLEIAKSL